MHEPAVRRLQGLRVALPPSVLAALSVVEWLRLIGEACLVVPAARFLPLGAAMAIATGIGTLDSLLPTRRRRDLEHEMRRLGADEDQVSSLVRQRLITRRRDLAWLERMGRGREYLEQWQVLESNAGPVHDLVASGRSFIVAGGHFTKSATKLRFKVLPPVGASVTADALPWQLSPRHLRERLANSVEHRARAGLLREHDTKTVRVGRQPSGSTGGSLQDRLVADLAVPGTVTQILVDAEWDRPNAYRRPFAGFASRGFALGAAKIARRAQCPIVPFVAVFDSQPRTVRIDWGDPIDPAPPDEAAADLAIINRALDFLDAGARRYPAQYVD